MTNAATNDSGELDDEQIQSLLLAGNSHALEYVYAHLGKHVFGVAISVTRNLQAAELPKHTVQSPRGHSLAVTNVR
jgi:hypothetical protein